MATMETNPDVRIKELYSAFNSHDLERFLSLHTEDIFYEQVAADGAVAQGMEEYRAFTKNSFTALPDLKCELISFFSTGNRQCEEVVMTGTQTGDYFGIAPTGKPFSFRGVLVRELREGKTSRLSIYWDNVSVLRQLGAK